MSKPYHILSLDGGGSWALLQVRCLQRLFPEAKTGHQVLRHFDLVAANSGGAIVLAGLVADMPLVAILELFETEEIRRDMFAPTTSCFWRFIHEVARLTHSKALQAGPHYNTPQKLEGLKKHLPKAVADLCLDGVPGYIKATQGRGPQVLIPTFDYNRQRSTFFRSDSSSAGDGDGLAARLGYTTLPDQPRKSVRLLEAVHASSTAPINFFDEPARVDIHDQPNYLWDGGVAGYNNPVLAAVTEALANGIEAAAIRVLSIGTGTKVLPVLEGQAECFPPCLAIKASAESGFFADVRRVASAITGAPPDAASYMAFVALNPGFAHPQFENHNFVRANPSLQPQWDGLNWQGPACFPDPEEVARLVALELDAVATSDVGLVKKIADNWLADELPNQPIRASATLQCLVGQATFTEVASQFKKVFSIPTVLTDLSRLPEIYALRVAAWEQSPGAQYVNRELFPQGWSDALDTLPTARHWVVEDEGRIVAAARVVVLDKVEDCGQPDVARFALPAGRPFGYLSRLVISPTYRHAGLAEAFDAVRTTYLQEAGVAFALAATPIAKRLRSLQTLGWIELGNMIWFSDKSAPAHLSHVLCLWVPAGSSREASAT